MTILNTTDTVFEILGHVQQADLLIAAVLAQDPDTDALCDAHTLIQDAMSQLRAELTERTEHQRSAA